MRLATRTLPLRSRMSPRGRLYADLADPVVVRLGSVLVAGEDLHVPEAQEEHREDRDRDRGQDRDPQGQRRGPPLGLGFWRAPIHRPMASPRPAAPVGRAGRPSLIDEGGAHHQSDAKEDGNRESRPDQAGDDRVAHDQEADVRVDARCRSGSPRSPARRAGSARRRAGRPPRGLGGRSSRGSGRRRSRPRAA